MPALVQQMVTLWVDHHVSTVQCNLISHTLEFDFDIFNLAQIKQPGLCIYLMNSIMHCSYCPFFYVNFAVANDRGFSCESAEGCRVINSS